MSHSETGARCHSRSHRQAPSHVGVWICGNRREWAGEGGARSRGTAKEATTSHPRAAGFSALVQALIEADIGLFPFLEYARALRGFRCPSPVSEESTLPAGAARVNEPRSPAMRAVLSNLRSRKTISAREDEVARDIGLSPSHLGRLLRRESGMSFREWRIALVMKAAVVLVARSDDQVAQIAYHFGYAASNVSQFTTDFGRFFGMCPTAFRKMALASPDREVNRSLRRRWVRFDGPWQGR
jgi:AraC-like DNA-binding protein